MVQEFDPRPVAQLENQLSVAPLNLAFDGPAFALPIPSGWDYDHKCLKSPCGPNATSMSGLGREN